MSNSLKKSERRRAQVWGIRKDPGWFLSRLTKPSHVGAFFCPGKPVAIATGSLPRAGKAPSMVATSAIEALLYHLPRTENPTEFALHVVEEFEERHDRLTAAQRETLHYLCCGFGNKDIARECSVSVRTIEQRNRRIYHVFNVANAAEVGVIVGAVEAIRMLLADELSEREDELADVLPLAGLWEGGAL